MTNGEAFGIMKLISYDMEYGGYPHIDAEVEELKLIALDKAIDALAKQMTLKPDVKIADGRKVYYCNACGCSLCDDDGSLFCSFCGQKVDWSDIFER